MSLVVCMSIDRLFQLDTDATIYIKQCTTSKLVCKSPFVFEGDVNYLLVGFAREVQKAATYEECLTVSE